ACSVVSWSSATLLFAIFYYLRKANFSIIRVLSEFPQRSPLTQKLARLVELNFQGRQPLPIGLRELASFIELFFFFHWFVDVAQYRSISISARHTSLVPS